MPKDYFNAGLAGAIHSASDVGSDLFNLLK